MYHDGKHQKNYEFLYQPSFWGEMDEDSNFLTKQIITYIGNKRSLLKSIDLAIEKVRNRLNKNKLRALDAFSGTGIVSRNLKRYSSYLATIDIEPYAAVVAECYLTNHSEVDYKYICDIIEELNDKVEKVSLPKGFIQELYSPKDDNNIKKGERVFYTSYNAKRIDNYRRLIEKCDNKYKNLLLGPLLSEASVHANTSGVFKGFYKDKNTGIGCFGGTNRNALSRIMGKIILEPPVLSRHECAYEVFQGDANKIAPKIKNLDIVYLDPPYNQHPYGSNYFMLNLIVTYRRPEKISKVSGIPVNWNRSAYNKRQQAKDAFYKLITELDTKYLLVSYNNEGFITPHEMMNMLKKVGKVEVMKIKYNTFRGCRNLKSRNIHVTEHLYLVEKR